MKKEQEPAEVFRAVLAGIKAPRLDSKLSHSEVKELFAYVAVRDTLVELDVSFERAEELAGSQSGCARVRFRKCAEILGLSVTGTCLKD